MMFWRNTGFLLALSLLATSDEALAQAKPAKAEAPARAAAQVANMQQLCRLKEIEIVQMSNLAGRILQEINLVKDPKKQAELGNRYQSTKNILVDMESSWQRLSCTTMINSVLGR